MRRKNIALTTILAILLCLGGCVTFVRMLEHLLPSEEQPADGRTLLAVVQAFNAEMSFSNAMSSIPTQYISHVEPASRPRYSGAIVSRLPVTITKEVRCLGHTNTRDGYPVSDEAYLYFDTNDALVGINWSSYTRNVDWKPRWGFPVDVYCDGRVEPVKKQ